MYTKVSFDIHRTANFKTMNYFHASFEKRIIFPVASHYIFGKQKLN